MRAAFLLVLLPLPALADCPPQDEILSCRIGKKTLEVCHDGGQITYAYGRPGKPELSLSTPVTAADFTPWSGIGRAMWSSLAFHNDGITYEVWASIDKMMDEGDPVPDWEAGVNVLQGDTLLAGLSCDPGSVRGSLDDVFDLKTAAGQCWNFDSFTWQAAPCP